VGVGLQLEIASHFVFFSGKIFRLTGDRAVAISGRAGVARQGRSELAATLDMANGAETALSRAF